MAFSPKFYAGRILKSLTTTVDTGYSTCLSRYKYYKDGRLFVEFQDGTVGSYLNVSPFDAAQLMTPSVGEFFNYHIRNNHTWVPSLNDDFDDDDFNEE